MVARMGLLAVVLLPGLIPVLVLMSHRHGNLANIWCVIKQEHEQLTSHLKFIVAKQASQRKLTSAAHTVLLPELFPGVTAVLVVTAGVLTACGPEMFM